MIKIILAFILFKFPNKLVTPLHTDVKNITVTQCDFIYEKQTLTNRNRRSKAFKT